jgi:hypothetical protein
VLTGHIAHGATGRAAIAALQRVIDVSIYVAADLGGVTPSQWLKMQRPDRGEFLAEFCSVVAEKTKKRTETAVGQSGCVFQMSILRRAG